MDPTDWEDHKAEIERLYVRQDKTLKEVMEILRKRRNFHKTKKQYENAFKKWGWRKNKLSSDKWKIINRKISKRKRLGRDSEVYVDGIRYPPEKVQRGIRQGLISAAEMYSVPSPQTPEGIVVCSPAPTAVLEWPHELPWLQFLQWMNRQEHRIPFPTSSAPHPAHSDGEAVAAHSMVQAFQSFLPHRDLQTGSNMDEATRLAGVLQVLMPEEQDEGHRIASEVLCSPSSSMSLQERFELLFYLLSNDLSLISRDGLQPSDGLERDREREDELVLKVFRVSELNTVENMKHLLSMPGLTPKAIAEKVFGSAVRYSDSETITFMLEAGMDPQSPVAIQEWFRDPYAMTPLEVICEFGPSVRMVRLLLSHNADANDFRHSPCLLSALSHQHSDLIDLLLSHGANIDICLERLKSNLCHGYVHSDGSVRFEGSVYSNDILQPLKPFLDQLLAPDIKDGKDRKRLATMLAISITVQSVDWVELLLARDAEVNSLHEVKFKGASFHTTALGLAANTGNMEILRILLTANVASGPQGHTNANIIQPLTLAVGHGHCDAAVFLINCGGDINTADHFNGRVKTLFDRALQEGMLDICEYLLHLGAAVAEPTLQLFYGVRLCFLVAENDVDRILQLPLQEINLNFRSDSHFIRSSRGSRHISGTALEIAIKTGCIPIIEKLLTAGATAGGGPFHSIGGVKTAQYLNHVGLLPTVLDSSWQNILVSAIYEDDDTLVEYLLHYRTQKLSHRQFLGTCGHTLAVYGATPLEAAIREEKIAIMEALLACGALIGDGELTAAVNIDLRRGDELFLSRIVNLGSPLRCKAPTALAEALKAESHVLVEILLCSGLDLTGSGYSMVLAEAAMVDDDDLFQRILASAQWPKEVLGCAFTASIRHGKKARTQYLSDAGADLNQGIPQEIDETLWYPLQIAVEKKDVSVIKTLIDYGCDPEQSDKHHDERTPLQRATEDGNIEIVNLLLNAGADPDGVPVHDGTTALQLALQKGHTELAERLLDAGADVNSAPCPALGATALQFAAIQGFIGIARRLLELGADVNAGRAIWAGRTALEGAAEHGRLDMLRFLLANGALIDGRGRRQYIRAVKLAEWNGHSTVATFLRSHGQWTAVDTQRADMEKYDTDSKSEPDYENDLAWDYKIPWNLLVKMFG